MLKTGKTKLYKNRKFANDHPELTAEISKNRYNPSKITTLKPLKLGNVYNFHEYYLINMGFDCYILNIFGIYLGINEKQVWDPVMQNPTPLYLGEFMPS